MTKHHKTWAQIFGKERAANDGHLLDELEQQIEREEGADREMRTAIARAFGRPVQDLPSDMRNDR